MTPSIVSRRAFLKTSTAFAGASLWGASEARAAQGPLIAYVGTYSSPLPIIHPGQVDLPPGNGKGIHLFEVDRKTGALTPYDIFKQATSPSGLAFNAAGTHLYSANETEQLKDDSGTVSAFAVNPADGKLTLLNSVSSGGAGPTHVSVHPSQRFLLVANYFGGSVAVLPILPDGSLGPLTDVKKSKGAVGPDHAKSAPPGSFAISGHDMQHSHMIQTDPSGRFIFSVDLGVDQILIWKFDQIKGTLSPNEPAALAYPPGDGPRHFAFHPNGRWFYSLQEEGSTVALCDYDADRGRITPRQTISSLPPGFAGSNFCSEIMMSPDGKFVYAANRLHDSIAFFSVGADGTLTFIGEEWTRGDYPRSFNLEPSGTFLYSCNQRADHITVFRKDAQTGVLTFTGQYIPVGNPSIIVFREVG